MKINNQVQLPVELVKIDNELAGQRLDNFLIARLKGVPKSRIYKMFRKGEVRINKGRIKPHYRLVEGDLVRIPPIRISLSPEEKIPTYFLKERLEKRVLYEDDRLLILNKPSGLAVHGGSGLSFGVIEGLRAIRPDAHFLELVHRLDKETSGCLIIAKKRSALRELHALFREDKIDKRYLALLVGTFSKKQLTIDAPLNKNIKVGGERVVKVSADGKPSRTEFRLKKPFREYTLVEARLRTGRTHQIRVHAAHIGFPLAGDARYGSSEKNSECKRNGLKRLFLHAAQISFRLPSSNDEIGVEAPMDDELISFLSGLPG